MNRIFYRKYHHAYKYELAENYILTIESTANISYHSAYLELLAGKLTIYKGYMWDGPSGPTFDTKTFMRASLVHDALYQLMRLGVVGSWYRRRADEYLREICIEAGMNRFRAWYVYHGVRIGSKNSSKPGSQKEKYIVQMAP